jgi:hypothetical protein
VKKKQSLQRLKISVSSILLLLTGCAHDPLKEDKARDFSDAAFAHLETSQPETTVTTEEKTEEKPIVEPQEVKSNSEERDEVGELMAELDKPREMTWEEKEQAERWRKWRRLEYGEVGLKCENSNTCPQNSTCMGAIPGHYFGTCQCIFPSGCGL